MSLIPTHRPEFTSQQAERLALRFFGVRANAVELPSERDRNFRLRPDTGRELVLKIANTAESPEVLDFQNQMMDQLATAGPARCCPHVLPSLAEKKIETIDGPNGRQHLVRLLTYLPDTPLVEIEHQGSGLLRSVGRLLGGIDRALIGFEHPAAERDLNWDLQHAGRTIKEGRQYIEDPRRKAIVDHFLQLYHSAVQPQLSRLRSSVIHNDANDYNLLVGSVPFEPSGVKTKNVVGIIDFGDALFSHTINELAVAVAYCMLGKPDPLFAAACVAAGYHETYPIPESELDVLFILACMRLCMSVSICALQQKQEPDNSYLRVTEGPAWLLLARLTAIDPDFARFSLRRACGFPAGPRTEAVRLWLQNNTSTLGPVVEEGPAPQSAVEVDLSFHSPEPASGGIDTPAGDVAKVVKQKRDRANAAVALGRYGEVRLVGGPEKQAVTEDSLPARRVHLGVDLFVEAGTPVLAVLDGEVFRLERSSNSKNGITVILKHAVDDGDLYFFTAYSHLGAASVSHLEIGAVVQRGAELGRVSDNGSEFCSHPHLHFQIAIEDVNIPSLPHSCPVEHREVWQDLCPEPRVALNLDPAGSSSGRDRQSLLEVRSRLLGPSLSISYREPLKIVRGYMQYLYGDDGRAYLDAVNNVPHVGHCHPRVVGAAQRQIGLLNTNTRYLHDYLVLYAERLTATLPEPLSVCFFVCSGSEANELAIRLAKAHTAGTDFVVVDGAYHGNTSSLVEISPYKFDGPGGRGAPPYVHKVPTPDPYRGRYRAGESRLGTRYADHIGKTLEHRHSDGKQIAAFFCESILGCAGQIVLPEDYLREAYKYVHAAGGVCVADEVQVGFGRVGTHFWAFETQGVVPDIVTLGKPIGNGHPLAAVITTPKIAASFADGMEYFNTFGGNPVSCAVGLAVLDVIEDEGLQENARQTGAYLLNRLRELKQKNPVVGDVRGLGLFIGIELVLDAVELTPATEYASFVVETMKDRGILLSTDGPLENVLKIKPPLVFTRKNADQLVDTLEEILYDSR